MENAIPGFSAELALYSTTTHVYREYGASPATDAAQLSSADAQVVPASGCQLCTVGIPPHCFRCEVLGETCCGSSGCTDIQTDPSNCGVCGNICDPHLVCRNGECKACVPGTSCDNICVDISSNSMNCGGCGKSCSSPGSPGSICCNGTCTNRQSDPDNCGVCGLTCWSGCCINGKCADTLTDDSNCGGCRKSCSSPGSPGPNCCNGTCTNINTDPNNCGACWNVCPNPQTCCNGTCCLPGQTCSNSGQCQGCQFVDSQGLVPDSSLQDGDVLVFVPTDITGALIDMATGSDGYSHVGVVCGGCNQLVMIDVDNTNNPTSPQVETVPLASALQRQHVAVRFGLTESQAAGLCACAQGQLGDPMFSISSSGLFIDLCTTLVMDCLDVVGFNRAALGLGGSLVTPNQIAEAFNAPEGTPWYTLPWFLEDLALGALGLSRLF
jgi:hypothetical protein